MQPAADHAAAQVIHPFVKYFNAEATVREFNLGTHLVNLAADKYTESGSWQAHAIQVLTYATHLSDTVTRMALLPILNLIAPFQWIYADFKNNDPCWGAMKIVFFPVTLLDATVKTVLGEVIYGCTFLVHLTGLTTLLNVCLGSEAKEHYFRRLALVEKAATCILEHPLLIVAELAPRTRLQMSTSYVDGVNLITDATQPTNNILARYCISKEMISLSRWLPGPQV